ncbi:hypothetical protein [Streptomyces sp. NPDC096030]|uniref:hypothetical protein n=1 Tax=Streptomyces sp. NPDC096030 TaxID=3155423 RepID=UPI0033344830
MPRRLPADAAAAARPARNRPQRRDWLRRVRLATAVVMAVTTVPVLTAHAATTAAAASSPAGVSGTVAMGGGASGNIHEQTGAFSTLCCR